MTEIDDLLIAILAQTDAVFEPLRDPKTTTWPATWQVRRSYPTAGLPWRAGGSKEAERTLSDAIDGDLVVRRRGRSKTVGVRLTPAGFRHAWHLVGLDSDTALVVAQEVAGRGPGWVRETDFNDGRGWGDGHESELKNVQALHAPALALGWIESNATTRGHVCYRIAPAGALAILEADANPPVVVEAPPASDEARAVYAKAYAEQVFWLDSLKPESAGKTLELGAIPLSMADVPRGTAA